MAGQTIPAGWYPDPLGRADWRYWDGEAWNARVADRNQRTWVDEDFLAEERARAAARGAPEPSAAPPPATGEPAPVLTVAAEAQEPLPESPAPTPKRPKVREHRVRRALVAARHRIAADLAAHWLAYIGVVLIFVGVFGFMVFSFREVRSGMRPLAELAIPLALAAAAWYLRGQRAPFVAGMISGLAGALVPIALIAAFNDGAGIPPDIAGRPRPLLTGALCVGVGAAYAWWTSRRPETPLRFLAGPSLWLGVGVAAGVFADPIPVGPSVARADAWQAAAMMVAIAATLLMARFRPNLALARSTVTAAFPGIAIVVAFLLAACIPDGGWFAAGTVTALAALVAFELLEPRLRPTATGVLEVGALVAAVLTLTGEVEPGWQYAAAALGLIGLSEWLGRRRTAAWLLGTTVALGSLALLGTIDVAWAMVVAFGVVSLWANVRRPLLPRWVDNADWLVLLAVAAPVGFAWGMLVAVSEGVALVVLAGVVLAVAGLVRLDRDVEDAYWRVWVPTALAVLEAGVAFAAFTIDAPMYWWLAGAAGLLAATAAVMPAPAVWRRWISAAATIWTAWLVAMALDLGNSAPAVRTFALGIATVVVTLAARRARASLHVPLALVGAALGLATLASGGAWAGWDSTQWTIAVGTYGGVVALGVIGSSFIEQARRALVWPWALAAAGAVAGATFSVIERPHAIGEGAAGYVAAAAAVVIAGAAVRLVRRWNVPLLREVSVGYLFAGVASLAVGFAATRAQITIGMLGLGALATAVATLVGPTPARTAPRTVSSWQRVGLEVAALAAVAAVATGPNNGHLGWLAAATSAAVAIEVFAVAVRWNLSGLSYLSAFAVGVGYFQLGAWGNWETTTWLISWSVAAATLVVAAVASSFLTRVERTWPQPWLWLGLAGSASAAALALSNLNGATEGAPGYVAAGATLAVASIGVLADRWGEEAWRWLAGLWIGLAAAIAAVAGDLDTTGFARAASITAIVVTVLVVATWRVRALESWHRAGTALAALALCAAVPGTLIEIAASDAWSEVASLATLLLFAFATEAWTFGTLWRAPLLSESAPFWLVGAWCAFAAGSLSGNAQWYTVPIGVALIGVEEIRRSDHRRAGLPPYSVSGRWIEYLGMMLIVAASLFQTVTVSELYALLGVVLGMTIATWGALTHVRRRAVFGTVATLLAVVLVLAVPLARALPDAPNAILWISLVAIGVIALMGAAFIERGRHAVRSGVRRFGSATHDWE